ncbi:lysozyme [Vibrio europaeus]|uniref:Lysozyme n=1 Tax=Vibrio europaeus TaxID=300876 RepID=A0ABT5GMV0_9VIBR|nr:lysozyme [Vibrio europaeus]MDC5723107.1 lysozyme [Vibrio europaeus]MDC5728064.1 lysozyme [Vibrio europaeus]MDC5733367.1 lysozyme [Vibrio europaeus]MDC5738594.1 lysozyme [Vibrio europaeus]MDC5743844.1 lysozyme [Vibrio europaeus]
MKHIKKIVCSVTAIIGVIVGGAAKEGQPLPLNAEQAAKYDAIAHDSQPIDDWERIGLVRIGDLDVGELIVSPQALKVIGNAEGCVRNPYTCPAGLGTDGIGNTHNVTGETKSDEQIAIDWAKNIIAAQNCLASSGDVSLMSQGQVDAFTSFIFNTGCTRFRHNRDGSETRIYHKIKQGWFTGACNELKYWRKGGGKVLPGLVKRRAKEMELCLSV